MLDAHVHLWHYQPAAFPWIGAGMDVLKRDYLLADLKAATTPVGVTQAMLVQAQQTVAETRWLLSVADADPMIAGVVGWAPLVDPAVEPTIVELKRHSKLRGLRHIVHDEPDDWFLQREDFNQGVARLLPHGLVYDILIFAKHLPHAIPFVDRHPQQPFVVDHIAKPVIRGAKFDADWAVSLRALAERPHVSCKLSGIVTEVRDPSWTPALIQPYIDVALEAFGPERLMFGSDWPVCRLRADYRDWIAVVQAVVAPLSASEQDAILGGTASRVYGLSPA